MVAVAFWRKGDSDLIFDDNGASRSRYRRGLRDQVSSGDRTLAHASRAVLGAATYEIRGLSQGTERYADTGWNAHS